MASESKTIENWYVKIEKYITSRIGVFVAFMFLLFALGAYTAMIVTMKWPNQAWLVVAIPAIAGIIAYYNRTFATIAFVILILLIFFL